MTLERQPSRPHDPGYPTFADFDPGRRAALRAIGLAGLSAVGLQLVGCGGGGSPPTTTEPKPGTEPPPQPDTEWVPWRDPDGPDYPVAGTVSPPQHDQPIAIVVGGGPIEVVFQDGYRTKLAVALVVQPGTTPEGIRADAPEHVAAVKAAAKALPGAVCDTPEGLETLAARIEDEVLKATPGLVLEGVQAAPPYEPDEPPAEDEASRSSAPAPRASASAAPATPGKAPVTGKRVWVPCGRSGCTACKSK